jgi:chromosome segregation ATPase
VVGQPTQQ